MNQEKKTDSTMLLASVSMTYISYPTGFLKVRDENYFGKQEPLSIVLYL